MSEWQTMDSAPGEVEAALSMLDLADRIVGASGDGALHIFIADGNVEDEDIEFCLEQPEITSEEVELCNFALRCQEEARAGAWFLANNAPSLISAFRRAIANPGIPIHASRDATNDVLDLAIKPDATGKFEGD